MPGSWVSRPGCALGWRGGDLLTLTANAGVMVARRDPDGMVTVPHRANIVFPAALRRLCGLVPVTGCGWPPCPAASLLLPSPGWDFVLFPAAVGGPDFYHGLGI
jgi:hypothetical protein